MSTRNGTRKTRSELWEELGFLWSQIQINLQALASLGSRQSDDQFDTLAKRIKSAYTAFNSSNNAETRHTILMELSAATKQLSALVSAQVTTESETELSGGEHS